MSTEHCRAYVHIVRSGFKSEKELLEALAPLTRFENSISFEKNKGFTVSASCKGYREGHKCRGDCLREGLKDLRILSKEKLKGKCVKHPSARRYG